MDSESMNSLVIDEEDETEELTTAAEVVQKLEEAWVNEKLAPDLLPYEGEIIDCLIDQMQHMENSLKKIKTADFRLVIHKMELDRIKFVLNSYLRIRLEKIEKYGAYLLEQENQEQRYTDLMSAEERKFAVDFVSSIKNYLQNDALQYMPPNMQSIKLEEVGPKPQMDKSVFIKVKKDCPGILIEETAENREEEVIDLQSGSQHILRYKPISLLVKKGSVVLI